MRPRLALVASLLAVAACAGADVPPGDADLAMRAAVAKSTPAALVRAAPRTVTLDSARLARAYARAAELPRLRSLLVQWRGDVVGERYYHGASATATANVKSASKSVLATLVAIAVAEGQLRLDQTIGELLPESRALDPAKRAITVEDLLTMRAGLQSTSFDSYGEWVSSRNWVRDALRRPMIAEPGHRGGPMIYSTGSSHLLSAILTRATGSSTLRYGQRVLARPLGITLRPWTTDPQGVYFGGNEMRFTPRELLAFGTLYLNRGRAPDGTRILSSEWIDSAWVVRGRSPWNGHGYGYGWWIRESPLGHPVYFAWGYGGQFVFVVPSLELVVVTTSDPNAPSRGGGHLDAIHRLVDEEIMGAVGG